MGMQAEGVEPAARIAAAARASGLHVHAGLLEDVHFGNASFDAVTLFEVLEHLREPLPLLQECHRILKQGGVLCLTTGNAKSWTVAAMGARWDYFSMEKDGGHISFYNPHSLGLLAQRTGFSITSIQTARVRFSEQANTSRALHGIAKLTAELLNFPARLAHRGHDMIAYLRAQ
jgi:2-polyprenyl-3-methyl-5-hydroxy-6-metoxy-1,4-benzoquinol methylase